MNQPICDNTYDIVTCIGKNHMSIGVLTINSLVKFTKARFIYVVSSLSIIDLLAPQLQHISNLFFLNEDEVIVGLSMQSLTDYFVNKIGDSSRVGWYFQQFLKMSVSQLDQVADYYLIWDSDTLLFKTLEFFDPAGHMLINPKEEYHLPYFSCINVLLGIERQVDFSFISEHLLVKKDYMKELLNCIKNNETGEWVEVILNSISVKNLIHSGFSEYETYGNFVFSRYKDQFKVRQLVTQRDAADYYGYLPNRYDRYFLSTRDVVTASFERWATIKLWKIFWNKMYAFLFFWVTKLLYVKKNSS